ncbi:DUF4781 domain-containing protein [Pseudonocardia sp. C8]|uniref:preprotein translocase subunit SecA n=1 Tax=Pseudonocardia sp. C8 TaxID=2762759 RepID=UPI0016423810|nr:DUF4781 domain-containing protein [Pseudonocardia sp. C8]MBC3191885.1 DUF4781 domain-containing protein [Pseudonocardia sp. C8]
MRAVVAAETDGITDAAVRDTRRMIGNAVRADAGETDGSRPADRADGNATRRPAPDSSSPAPDSLDGDHSARRAAAEPDTRAGRAERTDRSTEDTDASGASRRDTASSVPAGRQIRAVLADAGSTFRLPDPDELARPGTFPARELSRAIRADVREAVQRELRSERRAAGGADAGDRATGRHEAARRAAAVASLQEAVQRELRSERRAAGGADAGDRATDRHEATRRAAAVALREAVEQAAGYDREDADPTRGAAGSRSRAERVEMANAHRAVVRALSDRATTDHPAADRATTESARADGAPAGSRAARLSEAERASLARAVVRTIAGGDTGRPARQPDAREIERSVRAAVGRSLPGRSTTDDVTALRSVLRGLTEPAGSRTDGDGPDRARLLNGLIEQAGLRSGDDRPDRARVLRWLIEQAGTPAGDDRPDRARVLRGLIEQGATRSDDDRPDRARVLRWLIERAGIRADGDGRDSERAEVWRGLIEQASTRTDGDRPGTDRADALRAWRSAVHTGDGPDVGDDGRADGPVSRVARDLDTLTSGERIGRLLPDADGVREVASRYAGDRGAGGVPGEAVELVDELAPGVRAAGSGDEDASRALRQVRTSTNAALEQVRDALPEGGPGRAVVRFAAKVVDAGLSVAQHVLSAPPSGPSRQVRDTGSGSVLPPLSFPSRSAERGPGTVSDGGSGGGAGGPGPLTDLLEDAALVPIGSGCGSGRVGCNGSSHLVSGKWETVSGRGPPEGHDWTVPDRERSWHGTDAPDPEEGYAISGVDRTAEYDNDYYDHYYDDSPEQTDRVLQGRIEVAQGRESLKKDKREVEAGTLERATYRRHVAEQRKLEERVDADAATLSPDRAAQVDEVVDGHQQLDREQAELAAERKQVEAGTLDRDTYAAHRAAYERRAERVYDATDELAAETGHDTAVPIEDGTGAGCATSGVFASCEARAVGAQSEGDSSGDTAGAGGSLDGANGADAGADGPAAGAVSADGTDGTDGTDSTDSTDGTVGIDSTDGTDSCRALAGISSCAVSVDSGDRTASASCTLTGAAPGCDTRAGAGPGTGSSARCATTGGDCQLGSSVSGTGAGSWCSSGGRCDSRAAAARPAPPGQAEAERPRGRGEAAAHCEGRCSTTTSVVRPGGEGTPAQAHGEVTCAGARPCTGEATSSAGDHRSTSGPRRAGAGAAAALGGPRSAADADASPAGPGSAQPAGRGRARATPGDSAPAGAAAGGAARQDGSGSARCTVSGGACQARSGAVVSAPRQDAPRTAGRWPADATTTEQFGHGEAEATVDCAGRAGCTGSGSVDTRAAGSRESGARAVPVTRETTGSSRCTAEAGRCTATSTSDSRPPHPGDHAGPAATLWGTSVLAAGDDSAEDATQAGAPNADTTSRASATVDCSAGTRGCTGTGSSSTSGTGAGDRTVDPRTGKVTPAVAKTSTGSSDCRTRGGGCSTTSESSTGVGTPASARAAGTRPAATGGLVSVSHASGEVDCPSGSAACSGEVHSRATGADAAVDGGRPKSTSGGGTCEVTGGGCQASTTSSASSGPEQTLPGQERANAGPSAVSTSSARVECAAGTRCSGTATSTATSHDPATGAPRTSTGRASCTGGGGECAPRTTSVASTGPGAARALSGTDAEKAAGKGARKGPSAASAAGAALTCSGDTPCTGRVRSAADGTDPDVAPTPRGSHGSGSCDGATGTCRAVTNSGASASPDASVISPLVTAPSSDNATVRSAGDGETGTTGGGHGRDERRASGEQPKGTVPTVPGGSPGAGANVAPTVAGASSWTNASATLDCPGGEGRCAGTVRSSAAGDGDPNARTEANGARGPPAGEASSSSTCTTTSSGCRAQTGSTAGAGQVVADTVALQRRDQAARADARAEQARRDARDARAEAAAATEAADDPGATAAQRRAAAQEQDEAGRARRAAAEAGTAAAEARKAARAPVTDAPATRSTSQAGGQCAGSGCRTATTGDARTVTPADGGRVAGHGTSRARAGCAAGPSGCAAGSDAAVTTDLRRPGTDADGAGPVRSGSTQAGAQIDCPDAACRGRIETGSGAAASADGGARRALGTARDAREAADRDARGTRAGDRDTARAGDRDTARTGDRDAAGAGDRDTARAGDRDAARANRNAAGDSRDTGPGAPATTAAGNGAATDPTSVSLADGHATCTGRAGGCRAAAGTDATTTVTGAAGVTTTASAEGACRAGTARCGAPTRSITVGTDDPSTIAADVRSASAPERDGTSHAVATSRCGGGAPGCRSETGGFAAEHAAEVTARCSGTGCAARTEGTAADRTAGTHTARSATRCTAAADGTCGGSSRVGASPSGAEVSAACAGSPGSTCRHDYAAHSRSSSGAGGNSASAHARCGSGGGSGSGWCATSAVTEATGGSAMAAAACQGSAGSGCSHGYRARSAASAGGGAARASADGHGGGTTGAGQVMTSAQATAGDGSASAAASCTGSAGTSCRHSYSATASDSASSGGNTASASASGSGGGAMGGGGVSVSAQADAGPGFANASASCSGAANCSHSYSASASASASDGANWARASASGSGGGGQGGGGVSVSAQADAGPGFANASASCSGAANCSSSYSAHAEADDQASTAPTWNEPGGQWKAHGEGTCSGSGNGGCGVQAYAKAGPGGGGGATCSGNCANFTQSGSNTFTRTAPSLKQQHAAAQQRAREGRTGPDGKPIPIEDMGKKARGVEGSTDEEGNRVLKVKPAGGEVRTEVCADGCRDGAMLRTESGETIRYDPKTGFDGSMPTEQGARTTDRVSGSEGVSLYRDAEGNGAGTVTGSGSVTDGRTGETVTYTRSAPSSNNTNTYRLSNPAGSPFRSSCNGGCEYRGATATPAAPKSGRDHLVVEGASGDITGRDGAGNPATITFQGKGKFTSAEGDVLTAEGNAAGSPANQLTTITTRGPNGQPGRYDIAGGQSGSVRLKEGYTLKQDGRAWMHEFSDYEQLTALNQGGGLPPEIVLGTGWGIGVTTPDGQGKGGTLDCEGHCDLTRPAGQHQTPRNYQPVRLHQELGTGEGTNPHGTGSVENLGAGGVVELTDPYGNRGRCEGAGCGVVQRNGPGGGTFCHGENCWTSNTKGDFQNSTKTGGGAYLLNPTSDGRNSGRGCQPGSGGECTGGGSTNLGWYGSNRDGSLNLITDKDARRAPMDTPVDDQLKQLDKERYQRDGTLPMLSPQAYQQLSPEQQKQYKESLNLSELDKGLAVLDVGGAASDAQYDLDQVARRKPGLDRAMDAVERANEGGMTDGERQRLAPELKKIDEAGRLVTDFDIARRTVEGAASISGPPTIDGHRPISADNQEMAGDPALIGRLAEISGNRRASYDSEMAALGPHVGVPHGTTSDGKPLDVHGDPITNPTREEATRAAAQQTAQLSLIPRTNDVQRRTAVLGSRMSQIENGAPTTPAEIASLTDERAALVAENDLIEEVRGRLPEGPKPEPGRTALLRRYDQAFADSSGDPLMAGRLRAMNDLQTRADGLGAAMERSGDPDQRELAGSIRTLGRLGELGYATAAHDTGSRSAANRLDDLRLPSTGASDTYFALRSAKNAGPWRDHGGGPAGYFDSMGASEEAAAGILDRYGEPVERYRGRTVADRRAEYAAEGTPEAVSTRLFGAQRVGDTGNDAELEKALEAQLGPEAAGKVLETASEEDGGDGEVHRRNFAYKDAKTGEFGFSTVYLVENEDGGTTIVDTDGSHYEDLEDYQHHNEKFRPDDELVVPEEFNSTDGPVSLRSADGHETSGWDVAAEVVSVGAMVVGGGLVLTGVAAPVGTGLIYGGMAVGAGTSAVHLTQRAQHGQTINPMESKAAAFEWVNLAGSAVAGGGAATRVLARSATPIAVGRGAEITGNVALGGMGAYAMGDTVYQLSSGKLSPAETTRAWITLAENGVLTGVAGLNVGKSVITNRRARAGTAAPARPDGATDPAALLDGPTRPEATALPEPAVRPEGTVSRATEPGGPADAPVRPPGSDPAAAPAQGGTTRQVVNGMEAPRPVEVPRRPAAGTPETTRVEPARSRTTERPERTGPTRSPARPESSRTEPTRTSAEGSRTRSTTGSRAVPVRGTEPSSRSSRTGGSVEGTRAPGGSRATPGRGTEPVSGSSRSRGAVEGSRASGGSRAVPGRGAEAARSRGAVEGSRAPGGSRVAPGRAAEPASGAARSGSPSERTEPTRSQARSEASRAEPARTSAEGSTRASVGSRAVPGRGAEPAAGSPRPGTRADGTRGGTSAGSRVAPGQGSEGAGSARPRGPVEGSGTPAGSRVAPGPGAEPSAGNTRPAGQPPTGAGQGSGTGTARTGQSGTEAPAPTGTRAGAARPGDEARSGAPRGAGTPGRSALQEPGRGGPGRDGTRPAPPAAPASGRDAQAVEAGRADGSGGTQAPPGTYTDPRARALARAHDGTVADTAPRGGSQHGETPDNKGPPAGTDDLGSVRGTAADEAGAPGAPGRGTTGAATDPTTTTDSTTTDSTTGTGHGAGGKDGDQAAHPTREGTAGGTAGAHETGARTGDSGPHATTRAESTYDAEVDAARVRAETAEAVSRAEAARTEAGDSGVAGTTGDRAGKADDPVAGREHTAGETGRTAPYWHLTRWRYRHDLAAMRTAESAPLRSATGRRAQGWDEIRAALSTEAGRLADEVGAGTRTVDDAMPAMIGILARTLREHPDSPLHGKRGWNGPARARPGQLIGALAMARDRAVVEQWTGQGKTVSLALAAGARVLLRHDHVKWVTPNEALIDGAYRMLRPMLDAHGRVTARETPAASRWTREAADRADAVVATLDALRFRVLEGRNGMGTAPRPADFLLFDEIDYTHLDQARVHARLAAPEPGATRPVGDLGLAQNLAERLTPHTADTPDGHFTTTGGRIELTGAGVETLRHGPRGERHAGVDLDADAARRTRVQNALAAKWVIRRGEDYVVGRELDGRPAVLLIDQARGRSMPGHRWDQGLMEAVEFREFGADGVGRPTRTVDALSLHDFIGDTEFAGTTGTVGGAAGRAAFAEDWGKRVVHVKPDTPHRRVDLTRTFRTVADAHRGLLADVQRAVAEGLPVAVDARSVTEAHQVSALLDEHGIRHRLLTTEQHLAPTEDMAVALAGMPGQVTVSTHMIGRGTDIKLGGDADWVANRLLRPRHPDLDRAQVRAMAGEMVERFRAGLDREGGGLQMLVLGDPGSLRTEMQSRGRAGRDGQYGVSRLYRSGEDRPLENGQFTYAETRVGSAATRAGVVDELTGGAAATAERLFAAARAGEPSAGPAGPARLGRDGPGNVRLTRAQRAALPALVDVNTSNVALEALARARLGRSVPGLDDQQNERLQQLVAAAEAGGLPATHPAAPGYAEIAELIPARELRPRHHDLADAELLLAEAARAEVAIGRTARLAEAVGLDPAGLSATLTVAQQMLDDRQRDPGRAAAEGRRPGWQRLRVGTLRDRELVALLEFARGRPEAEIAAGLDVPVGELGWFLRTDPANPGVVVQKLTRESANDALTGGQRPTGRHVRTEAQVRAAALHDRPAGPARAAVRDALRAAEQQAHPLERALFHDPANRVEELVESLPAALRDRTYGRLIEAGLHSVAQVHAAHTGTLREAGLGRATIRSLRTITGTPAGGRSPVDDRAGRRASLGAAREWGIQELAVALGREGTRPVTAPELAALRDAAGLDRLGVLLDGARDPGPAAVGDALLAAHAGAGPVPMPGTGPGGRAVALVMLDARVAARAGAPGRPASGAAGTEPAGRTGRGSTGRGGTGPAGTAGSGPAGTVGTAPASPRPVSGAAGGAGGGPDGHASGGAAPSRWHGGAAVPGARGGAGPRRWAPWLPRGPPAGRSTVERLAGGVIDHPLPSRRTTARDQAGYTGAATDGLPGRVLRGLGRAIAVSGATVVLLLSTAPAAAGLTAGSPAAGTSAVAGVAGSPTAGPGASSPARAPTAGPAARGTALLGASSTGPVARGTASLATPTAGPTAHATAAPTEGSGRLGAGREWVRTRPGDSLWAIATSAGLTWSEFYRLNAQRLDRFPAQGRDLDLIYPGERWRIAPPAPQRPERPEPPRHPAPDTPGPGTPAPSTPAPSTSDAPPGGTEPGGPRVTEPAGRGPWWTLLRVGVPVLTAIALVAATLPWVRWLVAGRGTGPRALPGLRAAVRSASAAAGSARVAATRAVDGARAAARRAAGGARVAAERAAGGTRAAATRAAGAATAAAGRTARAGLRALGGAKAAVHTRTAATVTVLHAAWVLGGRAHDVGRWRHELARQRSLVAEGLTTAQQARLSRLHRRAPAGTDPTRMIADAVGLHPAALRRIVATAPRGRVGSRLAPAAFRDAVARAARDIAGANPRDRQDVAATAAALHAAATARRAALAAALDRLGPGRPGAAGLLRRAARGGGVIGRVTAAARGLRLDRPVRRPSRATSVTAGARRAAWLAAGGGLAGGAVGGLLIGAGQILPGVLAALVLPAAVVALRPGRGGRSARGPPRWVGAAASLPAAALGTLAGMHPGWVAGLFTAAAVPRLLAAAVSVLMVYRSVHRRLAQAAHGGAEARVRWLATRSAALTAAVAGVAAVLVTTWFSSPVASVITIAVAAGLGPALQTKDTGLKRLANAVWGVVWGIPTGLVAIAISYRLPAPDLVGWLTGLAVVTLVALAGNVVAVWVMDRLGRWGGVWAARAVRSTGDLRAQLVVWWLRTNLLGLKDADLRSELLKLDGPVGAVAAYLVLRPWQPGEPLSWVALRAALAFALVVAVNRVRDRLDHRLDRYADRSTRRLRIAPNGPATGSRYERLRAMLPGGYRTVAAAEHLRDALDALLGAAGEPRGLPGDPAERAALADRLAGVLERVLARAAPRAAEPVPDTTVPGAEPVLAQLRAAAAEERRSAAAREEQQVVVVAHALPVLARLLERVRDRDGLGRAGRQDLTGPVELLQQVLERLGHGALAGLVTDAGPGAGWDALPAPGDRLLEQADRRRTMRAEHLAGPATRLATVQRELALATGDPGAYEHALQRLIGIHGRLAREAARHAEADPLHEMVRLFPDRVHALGEDRTPRDGLDPRERALTVAALTVLHRAGELGAAARSRFVERARERARWRDAIRTARAAPASPAPAAAGSALEVLLTLAGEPGARTAADLAARYGDGPWSRLLTELAGAGVLTGDARAGYRAQPTTVARWRSAPASLRHALRHDARALPGGSALDPLTRTSVEAGGARRGHDALLELLRTGTRAFRHPGDGLRDDLGLVLTWLRGAGYTLVHAEGRIRRPAARPSRHGPGTGHAAGAGHALEAGSGRAAAGGAGAAELDLKQLLADHLRSARLSERLFVRARRAHDAALRAAARSGPRGPPGPVAELVETTERALHAAAHGVTQAFAALAEATELAGRVSSEAGTDPHEVLRLLRPAQRVLERRPGADPVRPAAHDELGDVRREMHAARAALRTGRDRTAVHRAFAALRRHHGADARAREAQIDRTAGGALRIGAAILEARALMAALGPGTVPPDPGRPATPGGILPGDDGGGAVAQTGADGAAVARTTGGLTGPVNQDAAAVGRTPDGRWYAVVADGLSSGVRSEAAARAAVRRARSTLLAGGGAQEAMQAASTVVTRLGRAAGRAGRDHPPATALTVAVLRPGAGQRHVADVAWIGDVRASWVPDHGAVQLLTADHARGRALTRWLALDRAPAAEHARSAVHGPGTLVVLTDGAWRRSDPVVITGDPAATVAATLARAGVEGRPDDSTVAAVTPGQSPPVPGQGGSRSTA